MVVQLLAGFPDIARIGKNDGIAFRKGFERFDLLFNAVSHHHIVAGKVNNILSLCD
ncbi:hypothetical protein D3C86_2210150 [compost metagenome]